MKLYKHITNNMLDVMYIYFRLTIKAFKIIKEIMCYLYKQLHVH